MKTVKDLVPVADEMFRNLLVSMNQHNVGIILITYDPFQGAFVVRGGGNINVVVGLLHRAATACTMERYASEAELKGDIGGN